MYVWLEASASLEKDLGKTVKGQQRREAVKHVSRGGGPGTRSKETDSLCAAGANSVKMGKGGKLGTRKRP